MFFKTLVSIVTSGAAGAYTAAQRKRYQKEIIRVYKEAVHNNRQINNIDNEAHKKMRDDFYWVGRYVNCILKPCIMANLFHNRPAEIWTLIAT